MTDNPFLRRGERAAGQSKGYWRSRKQEKAIAKRLGAWRIAGSGSGKTKGDVRLDGVARIEAKTTSRKSFAVTKEMLDKLACASVGSGEIPALVIEFLDIAGMPEQTVAVIPLWALEKLLANQRD